MKLSSAGTLFFCLIISSALAQFNEPGEELIRGSYSNEEYLFPLEPGSINSLAGTMGELRSNHFHSGIDIRTNNRIGVPVQSIQQGYVWRVVVSSFGFGNAVYVRHPNGQTSVYGHLDKFNKKLAQYVRLEQYRRKSFEVDLFLKPGQFNVNRGDTVAFSGNSGGSSGPHLHFDIRGKNNEALNPLNFHFNEVRDNISPIVEKVAFTTFGIESRINDQFGRQEFYVVRNGDDYVLPQPILASGTIGIELLAYDRLSDSRARCGINLIEVRANDNLIFRQQIDEVNFSDTRNILALMNYQVQQLTGDRYNKLFIDDGNELSYYTGTVGKGRIKMSDGETPVTILMKDGYGNESTLRFTLKHSTPVKKPILIKKPSKDLAYDINENTLKITSQLPIDTIAACYIKGLKTEIPPNYSNEKTFVYLVDLRKMLPDSISVGSELLTFAFKDMIPSAADYTYYSDAMDIRFSKGSLFDTTYLKISYDKESDIYQIGDPLVPLHRNISVTLKPAKAYSEKSVVYAVAGRNYSYVGGTWSNGKITFNTRDFGNYTLLQDTVPPTITKVVTNSVIARFKISDELSGISYFEASLNGEWLLMNYDYKSDMIWSEKRDPAKPLEGELVIKVVDKAGNEATYSQKI